jgi:colanic acid/amylovoran biosynthesis glycosyltransferase
MEEKEKILIYNNSFFHVSETFIYHQVMSLSEKYDVHLVAKKFENPHGYSFDAFEKLKLENSTNLFDRVTGKLIRTYFGTSLGVKFTSYSSLTKILKSDRLKAVHAHFGPKALEVLGIVKKYKVPLVVSFHGHDASRMLRNESYVKKLPELFEYASALIISGKYMADNLKLDVVKHKVHFIPYGVNTDDFKGNNKSGIDRKVKILHSGRIVGKKGVPDLIKVFSELLTKHDQIELHLVGDGRELEECKELVDKLALNYKVIFYGAVSHNKVKDIMNNADIFVLNSRKDENGDMEGTPVTILEAMSMGKAVVSTKHAGIPFVIQHGKNGLLVEEYSNDELKQNIEKLIVNPELRKSLGKEAEVTIRKSYSEEVMQDKIQKVFEEI